MVSTVYRASAYPYKAPPKRGSALDPKLVMGAPLARDQVQFSGKASVKVLLTAVRSGDLESIDGNSSAVSDLNQPLDANGNNALHLAAQFEQDTVIQHLLGQSVDVTSANQKGQTALMIASERGYTSVVRMLLKNSTPVPVMQKLLYATNHQGLRADQLAEENGNTDLAQFLKAKMKTVGSPPISKETTNKETVTSPLQVLKQHYLEKKPLSNYAGSKSEIFTDDNAEYLALRVQDDLNSDDLRLPLLTKIRLATQYRKDIPDLEKDFWNQVCIKACEKPILEFLNPIKKGLASVAGMDDVKQELRSQFLIPHQFKLNPSAFKKTDGTLPYANATPVYGLLLHGLGGTGKSFIAKKLVEELDRPYISLKFSDVGSKMHAETEKAITQAFEKAAEKAPSFIIVDEIDSFLIAKGDGNDSNARIVNTFMTELEQAAEKGITVIGTTNHKDKMEAAGVREGRFDVSILVAPPDKKARLALFNLYLPKATPDKKLPFTQEERRAFAEQTRGFSAPRIEKLCYNLGNDALAQKTDISAALMMEKIREKGPSYSAEEMAPYAHID